MHLTQFDVNVDRREAQRLLASPERLHAAVLGCFPPDQHSTDHARTLWRLDRGPSRHDVRIMIVSPLRPDLTALNEQAGWSTGSPGRSADYGPFLDGLEDGGVWRFRLTANPVHHVRTEPRTRGKRVSHVTAVQQLDWLRGKAAQHGFSLPDDGCGNVLTQVTRRDVLRFQRQNRTVTISTAQFDGVLEVQDVSLLRTALIMGIGPSKGYGCGLLTLAPTAG